MTPAELDEVDDVTVQKWLAVLQLEGEHIKEQTESTKH